MQAVYHLQPQNHYSHRLITHLGCLLITFADKTALFFCGNNPYKAAAFGAYFSRIFSYQANGVINNSINFCENDFYFNQKAIAKLSLNKIGSGLNGGSKYLTLMQQINNIKK